jgi:hypothetical protein
MLWICFGKSRNQIARGEDGNCRAGVAGRIPGHDAVQTGFRCTGQLQIVFVIASGQRSGKFQCRTRDRNCLQGCQANPHSIVRSAETRLPPYNVENRGDCKRGDGYGDLSVAVRIPDPRCICEPRRARSTSSTRSNRGARSFSVLLHPVFIDPFFDRGSVRSWLISPQHGCDFCRRGTARQLSRGL